MDTDWWWYMDTDSGAVVVDGRGDEDGAAAA